MSEVLDSHISNVLKAKPELLDLWLAFHDLATDHRQWLGGFAGKEPQRLSCGEILAFCELHGIVRQHWGTFAEHMRRLDRIWMAHMLKEIQRLQKKQ